MHTTKGGSDFAVDFVDANDPMILPLPSDTSAISSITNSMYSHFGASENNGGTQVSGVASETPPVVWVEVPQQFNQEKRRDDNEK